MSEQLLTVIISAAVGVLTAYFTLRVGLNRNKIETPKFLAEADLTSAEASSKLNGTALMLLQSYKEEVNRLHSELSVLRERLGQMDCRITDLEDEIQDNERKYTAVVSGAHLLYAQLVESCLTPVYKPPERRDGD